MTDTNELLKTFEEQISRIRNDFPASEHVRKELLLLESQLPNFPLTDDEKNTVKKYINDHQMDRKRLKKTLDDFDYENCEAYIYVKKFFNRELEMVELAEFVKEMEDFYRNSEKNKNHKIYERGSQSYYKELLTNKKVAYKYLNDHSDLFKYMIDNGSKAEKFK